MFNLPREILTKVDEAISSYGKQLVMLGPREKRGCSDCYGTCMGSCRGTCDGLCKGGCLNSCRGNSR